jgi:predicted homoserine dehydrogenase-like protein
MGDDQEDGGLDGLSAKELHDLAVRHALHHLDVGFFWRLMEYLPAAEAAAGEFDEAAADIQSLAAHIDDITDSGRGEIAELLRPFYLTYLREKGVGAESAA